MTEPGAPLNPEDSNYDLSGLNADVGPIINDLKQSTAEREVLPTNVKPLKYDIVLEPDFETFKFHGEETIYFQVNDKDSKAISLNSLDIEFDKVELNIKGAKFEPISTTYDKKTQTTKMSFDTELNLDNVELYVKFVGELNDKMAGFYRSTYEQDGVTKYLATTQMEPTDARRAFPCYDQPDSKARFDISLISDSKFTCLSNMDVKKTLKLGENKQKVVFNTTPLMSTYLVAFIVGDLEYVETNDYKVPIRVYTTPGLKEQGVYSLHLAAKVLEFYDDQFKFNYPLPKMDLIAIHDFTAGAMENFGMVTFRVVDLLHDESTSTLSHKQRVSEVVAHELAHQWFGDLVTMNWWEGLWLNEGFATWMSWFFINHEFPDWKVWEQYVPDSLQQLMSLDSMRSSHPIEVPVQKASEINQIFDAISYAKGSSVLKMIANWLGEDVFIKGVSLYLHKHAWTNTKTSDLWESLSAVSGKDVVSVMDIWTKKVGYPLLTVTEDGNKIHIKQNRFLVTADLKPEEDQTLYPVFLLLRTKDGVNTDLVLTNRSMTIELKDPSFYKLNADQAGIYRTSYTPERWIKLGELGKQDILTVEDRAGLIADAGSMAISGYSPSTNLLSLMDAWKLEESFTVWTEMSGRMESIRLAWLFQDEEVRDSLQSFAKALISDKLQEIGWEIKDDDSYLEQRLKATLFSDAVSCGDEKILKVAKEMFDKYISGDRSAINPNLRLTVFEAVAAKGDSDVYEQILDLFKTAKSADEKVEALYALGAFEDEELIQRTLKLVLDGTVRSQDIYIPLATMRYHKPGVELLFEWMTSKWTEITLILPPGLSMLGSVVTTCIASFSTLEQKEKVQAFFADIDTSAFDRSYSQALEAIQTKINWVERDGDVVRHWLADKGYALTH